MSRSGLGLSVALAVAIGVAPAQAESAAERCALTAKDGNVAACEQALIEDEGDLASRRHLAFAYLARNDAENAYRIHDEILGRAPDDGRAHFDYAVALATFRDYQQAAEPTRAAVRLNPDDRLTLLLASIVFVEIRRFDEAFAVVHRGAELGDSLQMFELAHYYRLGLGVAADADAARAWYERAAQAGHIGAMTMLVDVYSEGRLGAAPDPTRAEGWAARARREGYRP